VDGPDGIGELLVNDGLQQVSRRTGLERTRDLDVS
jgi:hypothetical protein